MQLYRHLTANNVKLTEIPFLRELSMESYLIENPEVLVLDNDELSTITILEVELPIRSGRVRKSTYGRIDLLALYSDSTLGIIELKLGELNQDHLQQLEDYLQETKQIDEIIAKEVDTTDLKHVGVLVGSTISKELADQISQGYVIGDSIPVAALTLKRYRGQDNNIYIITDTFFRNLSKQFDRTKYIFDNQEHGKNRLVLAIIKKYIEDSPDITYSKLESTFPKSLQGSWGCFDTLERAREVVDRSGYKRHFVKPEETIELVDATIAVSTQWALSNVKRFIQKAISLGYDVNESNQ